MALSCASGTVRCRAPWTILDMSVMVILRVVGGFVVTTRLTIFGFRVSR